MDLVRENLNLRSEPRIRSKTSHSGDSLQYAEVLFHARDFHLAKVLYMRALQWNVSHPLAIKRLSQIEAILGNGEQAHALLVHNFALNPSALTCYDLAQSCYQLFDDQSALKFYFQFISYGFFSEAKLFEAYKNIGNIFVRLRDFDSAEEYYNKAFTMRQTSEALMINFAILEMQKDKFDLAKQRFSEILRLYPNSSKAWVGLALIHRTLGDHNLAWANIKNALEAEPRNQVALEIMLEWSNQEGKESQQTDYLEEYLELCPNSEKARAALIQCYENLGYAKLVETEKIRLLEKQ